MVTDTDSLIYKIKSEDFYEEFIKYKDLRDCSNYQKYSKFSNKTDGKVIEKSKEEFSEVFVDEFIGLNSKTYSMK